MAVVAAEITLVVCETSKLGNLIRCAPHVKTLKTIIVMDAISNADLEQATKLNLVVKTMAETERAGKEKRVDHVPPKSSDLFTICYTSGTTGQHATLPTNRLLSSLTC
jgi:long-subunit acyl-CoA synthetase (AMP-forming)